MLRVNPRPTNSSVPIPFFRTKVNVRNETNSIDDRSFSSGVTTKRGTKKIDIVFKKRFVSTNNNATVKPNGKTSTAPCYGYISNLNELSYADVLRVSP